MLNRRKFISVSAIALSSVSAVAEALAEKKGTNAREIQNKEVPIYSYPEFDLHKIPFSYAGSFHTIEKKNDAEFCRLVVNTVRRSAISYKWQSGWSNNLFELALLKDGKEVPFKTTAIPWCLEMEATGCSATLVFADKDSFVVKTRNCALQLIPFRNFSWIYQLEKEKVVIYDNQPDHYYYLQSNGFKINSPESSQGNDATGSISSIEQPENIVMLKLITEELHVQQIIPGWDTLINKAKNKVELWMKDTPQAKTEHLAAVKTGWYLFWNLQVSPWRNYSRQAVLSSKKSMSMLWSWDICFNALALVKTNPELAWDQLFAVLDKQRENGLLPDTVNDLESRFGFNKPPVWGWTIMKMLDRTPKSDWHKYISEIYPKIEKFTQWWFENRNLNKQGICAYMHGNDSGWDNATIFDERFPVESPDLTAYIILQTEALSFMADYLGKHDDSKKWLAVSKNQLKLFKDTFITPDGFVYRTLTPFGPQAHKSSCLLTRVPLLLGDKLPAEVRSVVIAELKRENDFLTSFGIASEAITSSKYEPNGYWRGPVWAPSTYLIFDGLLKCGEKDLAKIIAQRFCDMVSRKATFCENYNALTGEGQYDSGLTWTASDFLLMAEWLRENS
jgi:hypothetical protein